MVRYAGKALSGEFRAVFAGALGDYKARHEWQGYSRYYRCRLLCECCLAQSPTVHADKNFTAYDFTANARWPETILTTQQVLDAEQHVPPLSLLEGWCNELFHRDVSHTLPLGTSKDSIASALLSLILLKLLGEGTPDEQLHRLHRVELPDWCKENSIRMPSGPTLSLRSLGRSDSSSLTFPELSSTWKAADVNTLTHFVAHKANKVCAGKAGFASLVSVHMWSLADFLWVLKVGGIELTERERARACYAGRMYLVTLQALCGACHTCGLFLWRTRFSSQGPDRQGPDRQGLNRQGPDRQGPGSNGPDRQGPDTPGSRQTGSRQTGVQTDRGPDRQGPDRQGPDRQGPDRQGPDRQGPDLSKKSLIYARFRFFILFPRGFLKTPILEL